MSPALADSPAARRVAAARHDVDVSRYDLHAASIALNDAVHVGAQVRARLASDRRAGLDRQVARDEVALAVVHRDYLRAARLALHAAARLTAALDRLHRAEAVS